MSPATSFGIIVIVSWVASVPRSCRFAHSLCFLSPLSPGVEIVVILP